jgi:aldose 1-epimerase
MNISIDQFGQFLSFSLQDPSGSHIARILPELGGIVQQLVLQNQEIINAGNDPTSLAELKGYPSAVMFPFASRVRDGQYIFEGQTYQLPINEPARNNAIHGFMAKRAFEVIDQHTDSQSAKIVLRHIYSGDFAGYPFPCTLDICYQLTDSGCFNIEYKVTNTGQNTLPFGVGWHPYFNLGNESVDQLAIHIPANEILLLDDKMMPSNTILLEKQADGWINLDGRQLDNCFPLQPSDQGLSTFLYAKNLDLTLKIWQETGFERYNYLVVFTPPNRKQVAIEPITNNVNAFNTGDGLISLKTGDCRSVKCSVELLIGKVSENQLEA